MSQVEFSLREARDLLSRDYLAVVKADLRADACEIMSMDGGAGTFSEFGKWVEDFAGAEDVYQQDASEILSLTDVEGLRAHFFEDEEPVRIAFRRIVGDSYRWAEVILTRSPEYGWGREWILVRVQDLRRYFEEERKNSEEEKRQVREDARSKTEESAAAAGDRWINAAFFDLEAEIQRQNKTIKAIRSLCEGREVLSVEDLKDSLDRMRKGNSAMHDIIASANNGCGEELRSSVLEEKPHNLRTFLDHFNEVILEKVKPLGIGFRAQCSDIRDSAVLFDQPKLTQMLSDLLDHTVSQTGEGGRILLRAYQEGDGRSGYGSYVIDMSHTGTSMTESEIEQLFDLNQQVSRGIGGSVTGLSAVKQMAELMGGDVSVKARDGVGNSYTVRVTMPLMSNEESNKIIADKRVLVVDDNLLNSEIVAEILREAGADVEIVSSGEEAVDMVSHFYEGYYDIVLTDIQMTGIDGYQTARRIRQIPWATREGLKIIALSSFEYDAQKDRDEGRAFNAYCMKPFDIRKFAVAAFDTMDE